MTNTEIIERLREVYGEKEFYSKQAVREGVFGADVKNWQIVEACDEAVEKGILNNPYKNPRGNWSFVKP